VFFQRTCCGRSRCHVGLVSPACRLNVCSCSFTRQWCTLYLPAAANVKVAHGNASPRGDAIQFEDWAFSCMPAPKQGGGFAFFTSPVGPCTQQVVGLRKSISLLRSLALRRVPLLSSWGRNIAWWSCTSRRRLATDISSASRARLCRRRPWALCGDGPTH